MLRYAWKIKLDDLDELSGSILIKSSVDKNIKLKDNTKYLIDNIDIKLNSKGSVWLLSSTQTRLMIEEKKKPMMQEEEKEVLPDEVKMMMEFSLAEKSPSKKKTKSASKVEMLGDFNLFESD